MATDAVAITVEPDYTRLAATQTGRPAMRRLAHHNPHTVGWTLLCLPLGAVAEVVRLVAS